MTAPRSDVDLSPWLAAIVASAEAAVLSKTLDGTILTWNEAAARLYGYTAEEIVGEHVSVLVPPDLAGEAERLKSGVVTVVTV